MPGQTELQSWRGPDRAPTDRRELEQFAAKLDALLSDTVTVDEKETDR